MKQIIGLLLFNLFFINCFSQAPPAQLHLRKNGRVKKRIETGTPVLIGDNADNIYSGSITYMKTDTLIINDRVVPIQTIRKFKIVHHRQRKPMNWEEFGYVTLGVFLATAGLALSRTETLPSAIAISATIGYSPYLIQRIKRISFKKYKYRIGGRFTLRVWDLH
jgi:hypothetical protein